MAKERDLAERKRQDIERKTQEEVKRELLEKAAIKKKEDIDKARREAAAEKKRKEEEKKEAANQRAFEAERKRREEHEKAQKAADEKRVKAERLEAEKKEMEMKRENELHERQAEALRLELEMALQRKEEQRRKKEEEDAAERQQELEKRRAETIRCIADKLASSTISSAFSIWCAQASELSEECETRMMPLLVKGSTDGQIMRHYSMSEYSLKRLQVRFFRNRNLDKIPASIRVATARKGQQEQEKRIELDQKIEKGKLKRSIEPQAQIEMKLKGVGLRSKSNVEAERRESKEVLLRAFHARTEREKLDPSEVACHQTSASCSQDIEHAHVDELLLELAEGLITTEELKQRGADMTPRSRDTLFTEAGIHVSEMTVQNSSKRTSSNSVGSSRSPSTTARSHYKASTSRGLAGIGNNCLLTKLQVRPCACELK